MTLPVDLKSFLLLMVAQPVALGILVAALLQAVFTWWGQTHTIRDHDKTLIAAIAPPIVAGWLYVLTAGLGYVPWAWQEAGQAIYNGVLAVVGSQIVYGAVKKVLSPPPQVVTNTTNVQSITSTRDVNLGNRYTDDDPLHGGTL